MTTIYILCGLKYLVERCGEVISCLMGWKAEGEFLVLLGAFQHNIFVTVLATTGIILGAAYSIWLYNRIMFNSLKLNFINAYHDINRREFFIFLPFIVLTLIMGIYPEIFLNVMHTSVTNILEQGGFK